MNYQQIIEWLENRRQQSQKDSDGYFSSELSSYYSGEASAYQNCLEFFQRQIEEPSQKNPT